MTRFDVVKRVDIRPFDFDSGKRLAIPSDQMETCDCCGKNIVKVNYMQADYKFDAGKVGDECALMLTKGAHAAYGNTTKQIALYQSYSNRFSA